MRHLLALQSFKMGILYYKILLCQLLGTLLAEGVDRLGPDVLTFLNAKLARRLSKLEDALCENSPKVPIACKAILKNLKHGFLKTLDNSNAAIAMQWTSFKSYYQKRIRPLPRRADRSHLKLTLLHSQKYLQNVVFWRSDRSRSVSVTPSHLPPTFQVPPTSTCQFEQFASYYWDLASLERDIELLSVSDFSPEENPKVQYKALADKSTYYFKKALDTYGTDPEQKSIMILNVIDLWVSVD